MTVNLTLTRGRSINRLQLVEELTKDLRSEWEEEEEQGVPSSSVDKWSTLHSKASKISKSSPRRVRYPHQKSSEISH